MRCWLTARAVPRAPSAPCPRRAASKTKVSVAPQHKPGRQPRRATAPLEWSETRENGRNVADAASVISTKIARSDRPGTAYGAMASSNGVAGNPVRP